MKTSPFFKDLFSLYEAEIDDLSTDSSGANVLQARLAQKRKQLHQLLPMMAFNPEMVAAAFHGAFRFQSFRAPQSMVGQGLEKLPGWTAFSACLSVEPWAEPLVQAVLAHDGGDSFLVQAAGLEFLMQHLEREVEPAAKEDSGDSDDLAQAGEDWMAEQGFDRLG